MSVFKASLNRLLGRRMLDERAVQTEQVILAPPFDEPTARAVGLISTRHNFRADESSRQLCQLEGNAASAAEYAALLPLFHSMPPPTRILEVGPGYGRSAIYFSKKKVFAPDATLDLYDTNGSGTKYKQKHYDRPPQWPDVSSFCGNLDLLRTFLAYNEVSDYRIFDATELPLSRLPGPYDFIYGFYSIGFHWSLDYYLDDLDPLLHSRTVLVCTLNKHFRRFPRLDKYQTRVLDYPDIKKNAAPLHLLALSKSELPAIGRPLADVFEE